MSIKSPGRQRRRARRGSDDREPHRAVPDQPAARHLDSRRPLPIQRLAHQLAHERLGALLVERPRGRRRILRRRQAVIHRRRGSAIERPAQRLNQRVAQSDSASNGQYTTDLITARLEYGFSTIAFANALLQYNTDAREWSSNLRFNIIHHPLSDFFLVFNERRDSTTGGLLDRALVAKMTYMVAFLKLPTRCS